MKKCLIVGFSTPLDTSFLKEISEDTYTIACDGGYLAFLKENKEPDLLVADFDTLDSSLVKNPKKIIKLNPIKDDTDIFYAIKETENKFSEYEIYGALGGTKLEHSLANIAILKYLALKNINATFYSNDLKTKIFTLKDNKISFSKEEKGFISIFSLNDCSYSVTEKGLKYSLTNYDLHSYESLGVSNEFIGEESYIQVKKGILLIVIRKI